MGQITRWVTVQWVSVTMWNSDPLDLDAVELPMRARSGPASPYADGPVGQRIGETGVGAPGLRRALG